MTGRKLLFHMIRDGVIVGALERTKKHCGVCGEPTCVVNVTTVNMPTDIKVEDTILYALSGASPFSRRAVVTYLGIGCGCYAKFHRQLAHIRDAMKRS